MLNLNEKIIPIGFPHFHYKENELYVEHVSVKKLSDRLGTPLYIYSKASITEAWHAYSNAIKNYNVLICYGMKANSNIAILQTLGLLGAGFDIVSVGELKKVIAAGMDTSKIVFSGVGKKKEEILEALSCGIKCFNVESESELKRISQIASSINKEAPISIRVNPNVDANTHPYISTGLKENKFGININEALEIYKLALQLPNIKIIGIDSHIGSQITMIEPYIDTLEKVLNFVEKLSDIGIKLDHIDLGGGLGIRYNREDKIINLDDLLKNIFNKLYKHNLNNVQIILEPGRSLVGNSGILLTTIEYIKKSDSKYFAIVDAAMNDIVRPALYHSYHGVLPIIINSQNENNNIHYYDIVGPVCESSDWIAKNRLLNIKENDILAIESAGAYCMTMASNYNTRRIASEVIVDGNNYYIIRERDTIEGLINKEFLIPLSSI